jgi:negative regulator of genetic competence, sporulation and motility
MVNKTPPLDKTPPSTPPPGDDSKLGFNPSISAAMVKILEFFSELQGDLQTEDAKDASWFAKIRLAAATKGNSIIAAKQQAMDTAPTDTKDADKNQFSTRSADLASAQEQITASNTTIDGTASQEAAAVTKLQTAIANLITQIQSLKDIPAAVCNQLSH